MQDKGTNTEGNYIYEPTTAGNEIVNNLNESKDYDSDATIGLETPELFKSADMNVTPQSSKSPEITNSVSSDGSLESVYEMDPEYDGPPPQSQPSLKHGITYIPNGMRVRYVKKNVKKRKLTFDDCQ